MQIVNLRQIQGTFEAFREIYGQMEQDVEERLRQKFTLIDKNDTAAIQAAQQVPNFLVSGILKDCSNCLDKTESTAINHFEFHFHF